MDLGAANQHLLLGLSDPGPDCSPARQVGGRSEGLPDRDRGAQPAPVGRDQRRAGRRQHHARWKGAPAAEAARLEADIVIIDVGAAGLQHARLFRPGSRKLLSPHPGHRHPRRLLVSQGRRAACPAPQRGQGHRAACWNRPRRVRGRKGGGDPGPPTRRPAGAGR